MGEKVDDGAHKNGKHMLHTDAGDSYHVLLVEDDLVTLKAVEKLLRQCSYQVTCATNGQEALDVLSGKRKSDKKIDLVLTDVLMPEVNGVELAHEMAHNPKFAHIPVVIMSVEQSKESVLDAFRAGAADYLIKPIRRNELTTLWQHVWRLSKKEDNADCDFSRQLNSHTASNTCEHAKKFVAVSETAARDSGMPSSAQQPARCDQANGDAPGPSIPIFVEPTAASHTASCVGNNVAANKDRTAAEFKDERRSQAGNIDRPHAERASMATVIPSTTAFGSADELTTTHLPLGLQHLAKGAGVRQGDSQLHSSASSHSTSSSLHALRGAEGGSSAFTAFTARIPHPNLTVKPLDLSSGGTARVSGLASASNMPSDTFSFDLASTSHAQHAPARLPNGFHTAAASSGSQHSAVLNGMTATAAPQNMFAQPPQFVPDVVWNLMAALHMRHQQNVASALATGMTSNSPAPPKAPAAMTEKMLRREEAKHRYFEKKKNRKFDKKVRYESRKRLAESRPRVKGQFVKLEVAEQHRQQTVKDDDGAQTTAHASDEPMSCDDAQTADATNAATCSAPRYAAEHTAAATDMAATFGSAELASTLGQEASCS